MQRSWTTCKRRWKTDTKYPVQGHLVRGISLPSGAHDLQCSGSIVCK
nr:MAG TPA: hypothetical protein [Caudoviricetes sp.]